MFVDGLGSEINEKMIAVVFNQFKGLKDIRFFNGRGFCFVEYDNEINAGTALMALNNMNVNDFKRNSNMFGLDFFTGDNEKGNNNTNKNSLSNNPFNKSVNINNKNNKNLELNNLKNSQNPHNKEVLNRLMNKIVPDVVLFSPQKNVILAINGFMEIRV